MNHVYLLTEGDGSDGDPWSVIAIYATRQLAEVAKAEHDNPRTYTRSNEIEEWEVIGGE